MASELTVAVTDLRAVVDVLLTEAERRFGPTIDLDADLYWDLDPRSTYDLTEVPTPDAGQLSDDVESVLRLRQGADAEVFLGHDLAHLVGILRRIAAMDLPGPT